MTLSRLVRVVIVEDDPSVMVDVQFQVSTMPDFEVSATCKSVKEAMLIIPTSRPDILLLDIHLGDGTAFDLLEGLTGYSFKVIFLTAHEQHAIKAIEYGALHYLLKPLDPQKLHKALQKVVTSLPIVPDQFAIARDQFWYNKKDRIVIHSQQFLQYIEVADIMYCQGDAGYTTLFLVNDKKIVSSKHLKEYEDLLPSAAFIRVHQSYIVNIYFIEKYLKTGLLILKNGTEIPVAFRKREYVKSVMSQS